GRGCRLDGRRMGCRFHGRSRASELGPVAPAEASVLEVPLAPVEYLEVRGCRLRRVHTRVDRSSSGRDGVSKPAVECCLVACYGTETPVQRFFRAPCTVCERAGLESIGPGCLNDASYLVV